MSGRIVCFVTTYFLAVFLVQGTALHFFQLWSKVDKASVVEKLPLSWPGLNFNAVHTGLSHRCCFPRKCLSSHTRASLWFWILSDQKYNVFRPLSTSHHSSALLDQPPRWILLELGDHLSQLAPRNPVVTAYWPAVALVGRALCRTQE